MVALIDAGVVPSDVKVLDFKQEEDTITLDLSKTFEEYIEGLNMVEAYGVETYDPGDGISTALPKKDTDLAAVCDIDLSRYISVLTECAGRL